MPEAYSIVLLDTFRFQDPEHEVRVDAFLTKELAIEFARRRVWDSEERDWQAIRRRRELRG